MSFIDGVRHRLRAWLRPAAHARDADRELRFHLELEVVQRRSGGATPIDAERAARRQLGSLAYVAEEVRRAAGLAWFDAARQDLAFALRSVRAAPGFAVFAALTLALGIGAATAVFSVVDGVLLRPLAIPRPDRVLSFRLTSTRNTDSPSPRSDCTA